MSESVHPELLEARFIDKSCRKAGCQVRYQFIVRELADGIIHWCDKTGTYEAFLVTNLGAILADRAQAEKLATALRDGCHGDGAKKLGDGKRDVDLTWWPEPPEWKKPG